MAKALLKVSEQHAEQPANSVGVKQKHDPPRSQTRPHLSYTLSVRQLITRAQTTSTINRVTISTHVNASQNLQLTVWFNSRFLKALTAWAAIPACL